MKRDNVPWFAGFGSQVPASAIGTTALVGKWAFEQIERDREAQAIGHFTGAPADPEAFG